MGCWSIVGRANMRAPQVVSIQNGLCTNRKTVAHELIHALGFDHEQNRPDRDDWVEINFDNIKSGIASCFSSFI
jgi:hypothetical protein